MIKYLAVLAAFLAVFVPSLTMAAPVVNVSPAVGRGGTTFLFYAGGFAANERFSIWLNGPAGGATGIRANESQRTTSDGAASFSWTAPANTATGPWQIVIHGIESNTEQVIGFRIDSTPAPTEGANINPSTGQPGQLFTFYLTGFSAKEQIQTSVSGPNGNLQNPDLRLTGPASDAGRIDGTWVAPADAVPGTWTLSFRGVDSGIDRSLSVSIGAPPAPSPAQLTISPTNGTANTPFLLSASGFGADETLSVWLNTPDGRAIPADLDDDVETGPGGNASWGWTPPANSAPGQWQVVAHGRVSGREAVVSVQLR